MPGAFAGGAPEPSAGRSDRIAPRHPAGDRLRGLVRLVHPFPSTLDGAAVVLLALVAGGEPGTSLRLGASMALLQAAIGTLNDLRDVSRDAARRPAKPIPADLVRPREAVVVLAISLLAGLALAATEGAVVLGLAIVGTAVGVAYDVALSGTRWSWVPWALGLPLLAIYAWAGATGGIPGPFVVLVPVAVLAGAALALANALGDLDRDRAAGRQTVAVALGRERTWRVGVGLHVVTIAAAFASLALGPAPGGGPDGSLQDGNAPEAGSSPTPVVAGVLLMASGSAVVGLGLMLGRVATARPGRRGWRPGRPWEVQALGVALVAAGWVVAIGPRAPT